MIVVSVHLVSAVSDARSTQLARMHISNDGRVSIENPRLGDYLGETFVGRDAASLAAGRVAKRGEVRGWRRHDFHVWNLVARMLEAMGYDKGRPRSALPLIDLPGCGHNGPFRPLAEAPRDGTVVEILIVHDHAHFSADPVGEGWVDVVRAHWIDHNGGGWTWNGLAGQVMGWRPLAVRTPGDMPPPSPPPVLPVRRI